MAGGSRARRSPGGGSKYLVYGPPKSGKTLLSIFLARRERPRVVYVDIDGRRQLATLGLIRMEPESPSRCGLEKALRRGSRLAEALGASLVVDSLLPVLEALDLEGTLELVASLAGLYVPVVVTAPWFLGLDGFTGVKVGREGDVMVASGKGVFLRVLLSEVAASLMADPVTV